MSDDLDMEQEIKIDNLDDLFDDDDFDDIFGDIEDDEIEDERD